MNDPVKMVLVWRHDLKVRRGKEDSQMAHAAVANILQLGLWSDDNSFLMDNVPQAVKEWIDGSFSKISVCVDNELELDRIYNLAKEKGLLCSLITDNGNTEFHGVKTKTCCAIGPDYSSKIDEVTGGLKLR